MSDWSISDKIMAHITFILNKHQPLEIPTGTSKFDKIHFFSVFPLFLLLPCTTFLACYFHPKCPLEKTVVLYQDTGYCMIEKHSFLKLILVLHFLCLASLGS